MEFIFALLVLVILFLITCKSMASIEKDIHRKADPFDPKCEERKAEERREYEIMHPFEFID